MNNSPFWNNHCDCAINDVDASSTCCPNFKTQPDKTTASTPRQNLQIRPAAPEGEEKQCIKSVLKENRRAHHPQLQSAPGTRIFFLFQEVSRQQELSTSEGSGWRGDPPPSWSTSAACWRRRRLLPWSPMDWSRGRAQSHLSPAREKKHRAS